MKLRFAAARLLALFRKRRLDRELEGEILAHLEMAELDALAAGLSPEEARREARRSFGGIEQMKEDHRDRRSVRWVENLWRDVRYGMAALARDPGFAAVTIGLLALGIGANTAMFSIVDAVLLKPLPFPEPERMVRVWESHSGGRNPTTTLTFLDWKRQGDIFEALSVEELYQSRSGDWRRSGARFGQAGVGRLLSGFRREASDRADLRTWGRISRERRRWWC